MLLKFCGLRRQEDVALAARLGATHCGFVFHAGSPRCVDAVAVSRLESGAMLRVGVFTGQDSGEIARIMRLARLDMAQLHAGQSVECARRLGPERVSSGRSGTGMRPPWKPRQGSMPTAVPCTCWMPAGQAAAAAARWSGKTWKICVCPIPGCWPGACRLPISGRPWHGAVLTAWTAIPAWKMRRVGKMPGP